MMSVIKWFPAFRGGIVTAVAATLLCPDLAMGSTFQNLDFESAVIGTPTNFELPASQAIPGWASNGFDGANVAYDTVSTGGTVVSIQDGRTPYGLPAYMQPIQGSYSALLQYDPSAPRPKPAWIAQTGDIPSYANSLMFESEGTVVGLSGLVASLNGTVIPVSLYSVGPVVNSGWGPVDTYIGDIRQFTGQQNVELQFTGNGPLDAIQFSSLVVPEPSSVVLLGIGVSLLAGCCWRRRNRATR